MTERDQAAIDWLLASKEPAVRMMARRDLLGEKVDDSVDVLKGPIVGSSSRARRRTAASGTTRTRNGPARTGASCRWSSSRSPPRSRG